MGKFLCEILVAELIEQCQMVLSATHATNLALKDTNFIELFRSIYSLLFHFRNVVNILSAKINVEEPEVDGLPFRSIGEKIFVGDNILSIYKSPIMSRINNIGEQILEWHERSERKKFCQKFCWPEKFNFWY
jgi:hypothetical protein